MSPRIARKSTPKVKGGRVQTKNDWTRSPDYWYAPLSPHMVAIDRQRPDKGYRHVLTKADIHKFLALLPDWNELALGLNAIVLSSGSEEYDGYHQRGFVTVCAWQAGLWREMSEPYFEDHRDIFERLEVEHEVVDCDRVLCKFDEWAVRAYQLLHILLHELGHHHDRMTTRRQRRCGRGEPYAERYAREHEAVIWDSYLREFRR